MNSELSEQFRPVHALNHILSTSYFYANFPFWKQTNNRVYFDALCICDLPNAYRIAIIQTTIAKIDEPMACIAIKQTIWTLLNVCCVVAVLFAKRRKFVQITFALSSRYVL